ncbi:hypothetical protein CRENBAI_015631 [Crenichthys baileyi]|uniref:Uncharacterized protein n=1 Tax=Crenichthys baileyi TaxID=28760 RepID=A0AAV9SPY5_9TELE
MTSYRGLRTHQGMMGCTPKGVRIPKEEQNAWKDCWKPQVDDIKRPVAKKVNMKQQNSPETPRMRNLSSPASAVMVKKENKSASSQRATRSKLEERSILSKNPKDYWSTVGCKNDSTAASRIKEEPISPRKVSIRRYPEYHKVTPIEELEDSSVYFKNVGESLRISTYSIIPNESMEKNQPSLPTQQRSLKKPKERKAAAAGLINHSVSKHPTSRPPVPPKRKNVQVFTGTAEKAERSSATNGGEILRPNEDSENAELVQNVGASPKVSSRLEKNKSPFATPPHLLKKPMDTKAGAAEQVSSWVLERPAAPPVVLPKRNSRTFGVKQLRGRDIPNDLQGANNMSGELKVKELVRMFSVSAVQQKTAGPKEKPRSEHPQWETCLDCRQTDQSITCTLLLQSCAVANTGRMWLDIVKAGMSLKKTLLG